MIIGISGKIASGKDLVGDIIRYLSSRGYRDYGSKDYTFKNFLDDHGKYAISSDAFSKMEIKKFADKIKDIVCLFIGCTREQLEDRDFKEKVLGEEWWMWEYKNYYEIHILTPYLDKKEGNGWYKEVLIKHTPRTLLQLLGTEVGRQIIHPNIWVNSLFADYKPTHKGSISQSQMSEMFKGKSIPIEGFEIIYPDWIVTDCRFPNEANAIRAKKGVIIRIDRPIKDRHPDLYRSFLKYKNTNHPEDEETLLFWVLTENEKEYKRLTHASETGLDGYRDFDYLINNNGSIDKLIREVKRVLKSEKLL